MGFDWGYVVAAIVFFYIFFSVSATIYKKKTGGNFGEFIKDLLARSKNKGQDLADNYRRVYINRGIKT